jgi:hypothetical protein
MGDETMHVEVLVFDGCPHAEAALHLAQSVTARLGPGITVERVDVNTPEQAADLGFFGSPSIRVNGVDIESVTSSTGRLCCRTYEGGAGVPPEWLVEAAVVRALPLVACCSSRGQRLRCRPGQRVPAHTRRTATTARDGLRSLITDAGT